MLRKVAEGRFAPPFANLLSYRAHTHTHSCDIISSYIHIHNPRLWARTRVFTDHYKPCRLTMSDLWHLNWRTVTLTREDTERFTLAFQLFVSHSLASSWLIPHQLEHQDVNLQCLAPCTRWHSSMCYKVTACAVFRFKESDVLYVSTCFLSIIMFILVTIISLNWSHDKKIHKNLKICSLKSHSSTLHVCTECVYMARNAWPKSFLTLIGSMLKTWSCLITRTYDGLRLWDKYLSCRVGHSGLTRGSPVHWKGPIWSCLPVRHLFWSLSLSPAKTGRGSGEQGRWWRWRYHLEQWETLGFVAGQLQGCVNIGAL